MKCEVNCKAPLCRCLVSFYLACIAASSRRGRPVVCIGHGWMGQLHYRPRLFPARALHRPARASACWLPLARERCRSPLCIALDRAFCENAKEHFAQSWNYRYSSAYVSAEYSALHYGMRGHDQLRVASAHVLPMVDRCSWNCPICNCVINCICK